METVFSKFIHTKKLGNISVFYECLFPGFDVSG